MTCADQERDPEKAVAGLPGDRTELAEGRGYADQVYLPGNPTRRGAMLPFPFSHAGHFAAAISATARPVLISNSSVNASSRCGQVHVSEEEMKRTAEPDLLAKLYIHWSAKEAIYKLYGGDWDIRTISSSVP
ncbi:MAG: 4'-phosphopantetheinyl transferase superfamily protein [Sphingobacterium sp.]|nr:4'-phosphopantetheinyl transferase superfamily protein [Sphingobacterium sp.]